MTTGPVNPLDQISARATRYELARGDALERGWKVPHEGSPLAAPDWHEAWINYWHAMARYTDLKAADPKGDHGRPVQPHRSGGGGFSQSSGSGSE